MWFSTATLYPNGSVSEVGNFSFGTHLARDHAIMYQSFGATGHSFPMDNTTVSQSDCKLGTRRGMGKEEVERGEQREEGR